MSGGLIRVVLADDHAIVREGTAELLERSGDIMVVGQASSGTEALQALEETHPDVLVLDLMMPGIDSLEVTRRVRAASPGTAVLILTAHEDRQYVLAALEAGATGYLSKADRGSEVIDAVRAVAAGRTALSPHVASAVVATALGGPDATLASLTARELDVLRAVARGRANKQIAGELRMSERTVQTHLTHVFSKLGVSSRTEAALLAVREGWVRPTS